MATILGIETFEEAQKKIEKILSEHPRLRRMIEETTVPWELTHRGYFWPCPGSNCFGGELHVAGRNKLPDGRLGLGSLLICKVCGYQETRK